MTLGDQVGWQWGTGLAMGELRAVGHERTQRRSNRKQVVPNGRIDDPAIIIAAENRSRVYTSHIMYK